MHIEVYVMFACSIWNALSVYLRIALSDLYAIFIYILTLEILEATLDMRIQRYEVSYEVSVLTSNLCVVG